LGKLNISDVEDATLEALRRLEAGERHLAIHPNCGTNFLTAGILAGGASYISLLGGRTSQWRDRLERLPLAVMAAVLALIIAQPLGTAAQRHITTHGDPTGLEVVELRRYQRGRTTVHRVLTRG
jgi:ABC-type proline/glycine betaine transport system permease subunit